MSRKHSYRDVMGGQGTIWDSALSSKELLESNIRYLQEEFEKDLSIEVLEGQVSKLHEVFREDLAKAFLEMDEKDLKKTLEHPNLEMDDECPT